MAPFSVSKSFTSFRIQKVLSNCKRSSLTEVYRISTDVIRIYKEQTANPLSATPALPVTLLSNGFPFY